jgi:hypothetical protein
MVIAMAVFEEPLVMPVSMIRLSSRVKCEKEFVPLIIIPAFPMAVRYTKSKTKCHNLGSGRKCKTKIYFAPFKVEINFSLQQNKKLKKI